MCQLLPRGFHVNKENRIKRLVAGGADWEIYVTNTDRYLIAVKQALYDKWLSDYALPSSIFKDCAVYDCKIFLSSCDYLISSMEAGPFPENGEQIEAFSIAFKTATDLFPNSDIYDAVYIEEYSLLLPVSSAALVIDKGIVYGKWLTGGIGLSVNSFDRVSKVMSWCSKEHLKACAALAGFQIAETEAIDDAYNEARADNALPEEADYSCVLPDVCGFSLIGRPQLEQFFNDNIIDIVLHQEQYKRMGISFPGATILYGPPGCGKTYAVEQLAKYFGWQKFYIDSGTIGSSYIHETSKKISDIFGQAIKAAPSILIIDEMEAFLTDRTSGHSGATHHIEEVSEFLRKIPEAVSKGVLVFAMTNMIDCIDSAVRRRGRFDHIVEVKMPTAEEINALLESKFEELPVDSAVSAIRIAAALDGHPMSDVAFVLREAGRLAVKHNFDYINDECFDGAIASLPKKEKHARIGFGVSGDECCR